MSALLAGPPPAGYTLGAGVLAAALKHHGVSYMFGVVGIPIVEVGGAAQQAGIEFVGFRNEQAASYAAGAASYLSGTPQACLTVGGPGVIHAVAGLANAWANCWPMLLIGGAVATTQTGMGAFQESPTLDVCRPFTKYQARIDSVARMPFFVARALHIARTGRPGPVYLELPAELVTEHFDLRELALGARLPPPPRTLAEPVYIMATLDLLRKAKSPLVIVGKGAAWSRAEREVRALIERTGVPFLATPMGKGVVPDDHAQSVAAARSTALAGADVVILLGARLNWILHFGQAPRFHPHVKIVQVDIAPEELHANVPTAIGLVGDVRAICQQLIEEAKRTEKMGMPDWHEWKATLAHDVAKNNAAVTKLMSNESLPMSYYRVFKSIQSIIPRDAIIVSEGANTLDIGRTILKNHLPRHRLDAGTFGTMGVGLGFAIAAAMYYRTSEPTKKVVCIEGDSAFGFSGMEFEVAARYQLPIVFIVVNNSGIYAGIDSEKLPANRFAPEMPVTALSLGARYEKLAEIAGEAAGKGYLAKTPQQLEEAFQDALQQKVPTIINVIIRNQQERKPQQHGWLTTAKPKAKL